MPNDTHTSTSAVGSKAESSAERLFKLFVGNQHRHVRNYCPAVFDGEKQKWRLTSKTIDEPVTLKDWNTHLYPTSDFIDFILSIIPLLDDGTCWFACIDCDKYELDYHKICQRIYELKLPLLAVVSKSGGLHLFIFFKEPVRAERIIPVLHSMAARIGFNKGEYEVFPTSVGENKLTRGISMPYGSTFNVLPDQCALSESGNAQLLDNALFLIDRMRIAANELPEIPKEAPQQKSREIPLALQVAIDSQGPYPVDATGKAHRAPICGSIIAQLRALGLDADSIKSAVEGRGPFSHYTEKNSNLGDDITRIISWYDQRHSNQKESKSQLPPFHMQSSAEFIAGFIPPDYLIDGIIQRRFLYSMTGPTGEGKTSVMLVLAYMIAKGMSLGEREIDKGKVLFLAGENPDDARMRWIKLLDDMKVDAQEVDVFFVSGGFHISADANRKIIMQESKVNGPFALIVVDTSAAFFEGEDDNNRVQMLAHAKMLRGLIEIVDGRPTVIVTSHPVKSFSRENMVPSGGGAFLNEVDGNLTCMKVDGSMVTEIHWQGKFRGIDFAPIPFRLEVGKTDKLKDSKGRLLWTVIARPISERERDAAEDAGQKNNAKLLAAMAKMPGGSIAVLADEVGWRTKDDKPNRSLVQRLLNSLARERMVKKENQRWVLTPKGKRGVNSGSIKDEEMPF
jgi:hypothetical protein